MKHFYSLIPGWSSKDGFLGLYKEMVEKAPEDKESVFMEIGAWKGRSASFMGVEIINSKKPIVFYVVDTFRGSMEKAHQEDPSVINGTLFEEFLTNVRPVLDVLHVIAHDSYSTSYTFCEECLDFVMIDGNHEYDHVYGDMTTYWSRLKIGGIMGLDDYNWESVQGAIRKFQKDYPDVKVDVRGKGKHRYAVLKKEK